MNNGDVVTMVTPVGEVIGKIKEQDDQSVTLEDPRLFVPNEGGAGLAPGICMTGEMNPSEVTFYKSSIVAMLPTHPDLVKGWTQATSGIVLS